MENGIHNREHFTCGPLSNTACYRTDPTERPVYENRINFCRDQELSECIQPNGTDTLFQLLPVSFMAPGGVGGLVRIWKYIKPNP